MLQFFASGTAQGQQLNASFTQGDVVAANFTGAINGTPINLTGSTVKMTIGFSSPLLLSTDNGGITITDALTGQFTASMSSSQTAGFAPGTFPYDVWIESQTSPPIETQYITGTITVNQSITAVP